MKALGMMTLVSQLEITQVCTTGDKEHKCSWICLSFGKKKMCVQPGKLKGKALIIPSSTVEAEAAAVSSEDGWNSWSQIR